MLKPRCKYLYGIYQVKTFAGMLQVYTRYLLYFSMYLPTGFYDTGLESGFLVGN